MAKILLVIFLSLIVPETQAAYLMPEETLRDLPKFSVIIDITPGPEAVKIEKSTLQTDVEVRLRKAGILIFNREEAPALIPYLHLAYIQARVAFSIELSLDQHVSLVSFPTFTTHASTWKKTVTGTSRDPTYIRQAIKDLTDVFINNYLSVNPRAR